MVANKKNPAAQMDCLYWIYGLFYTLLQTLLCPHGRTNKFFGSGLTKSNNIKYKVHYIYTKESG